MKPLSNLPPGVTDQMIEGQLGPDVSDGPDPEFPGGSERAGLGEGEILLEEIQIGAPEAPKKPRYKNVLDALFHETIFTRIRNGVTNGFRMGRRGTSAKSVGNQIEWLKKHGRTPKQGKPHLGRATGIGSWDVVNESRSLALHGKYMEAIALMNSWEPRYYRDQTTKAICLRIWNKSLKALVHEEVL